MIDLLAAIGAALASGVVMYFFGYRKAGTTRKAKETEQRLTDVKKAQEVRDEVETLDDVDLADRARRWVRGNND
jgi:uncharacterized protein HemX